jgi:hypothetical protein
VDYASNYSESLFCASSFKVFVLAAYLYYAERGKLSNQPPKGDSPSLLDAALAEPLTISDHTLGSTAFGDLLGKTTASAILSAMIAYSDNTATDIAMKRVGVENVRKFMYETAGLHSSAVRIPDSTKKFYDYLSSPGEHHLINNEETMVCTALAFQLFYQQTINRNRYFENEETRRQFMWFLSMSEAIPPGMPTDTVCYMKGGDVTYEGEHAAALAGHVTFPSNPTLFGLSMMPVNFAMLYNWTGEDNVDSVRQAFREAVKEVFAAIKGYLAQDG